MKWREELRLHGMEGGRLHGMERGRLQWSGGKKVAQKRVEMEKNKNCAKIVISVVEPGVAFFFTPSVLRGFNTQEKYLHNILVGGHHTVGP